MPDVFLYTCFGATLAFAESLGWHDWLDDVDDDTDPQTIDEAEVDALNFIRSSGFTIEGLEEGIDESDHT